MKKLFILLFAAMAFVACNDEVEDIDYSTWTVEELLTTGGGIDYLVSQTKEINYDELNDRLKTEVLFYWANPVFKLQDGIWTKTWLDGISGGYMVLMEDNTFRACYEDEQTAIKYYIVHDAGDNSVAEMARKMLGGRIVAYVGDTLVIEFDWGGTPTRYLAHFEDNREWVLKTYTNNGYDPETWQ